MLKFTLAIALMLGSACVTVPTPNPPRSLAELEPPESAEARKNAYVEHALAMVTGATASMRRHGVRNTSLSVLEQDGNRYQMWDYLPELQKVGLAKGVKNPIDDIRSASFTLKAMWSLPFAGYAIGAALCLAKSSETCVEAPLLSTLGFLSMPVPLIIAVRANNRVLKKLKAARKDRGRWVRGWNRQLQKKLTLERAPRISETGDAN